jgi:hypothetical protein
VPDSIQPVGAMIQPPDPNRGISTLSGILGLKQQQQGLQIGQQQLQQEQLKTAQQQGVQNFFQTWDPSEHVADDGSTDLDSALQSKEFKSAGNAKPGIMQALLDIKNKQLGNKQALSSLNKDLVTQFGTGMGALAKDDDVVEDKTDPQTGVNTGRAKVDQFLTNFSKLSPDAARVAQIYGPITQHAPPGKLSKGVAAMQLQAQSASEQQSAQFPRPGAIDTGSQILPTTTQPSTGIQTPTGQAFNKQQVVTTPAGPQAVATPARGTITPLTTAAAPGQAPGPELNVTTAQAATQNIAAQGVANRVSQAQAAANNTTQAQDALNRTRAILDKPDAINTGAGFEWKKSVRNVLASAGIDTGGADDANTLVKNLARYEASRATQAGLGGTDAARELAHNGSPNAQLSTEALKGVVTQSLATEKALAAYANIQSKTKDAGQLAKNEADFRSIPHLIEGYEYLLARNSQEAEEFLKKHGLTKAEMIPTYKAIKEFESR